MRTLKACLIKDRRYKSQKDAMADAHLIRNQVDIHPKQIDYKNIGLYIIDLLSMFSIASRLTMEVKGAEM